MKILMLGKQTLVPSARQFTGSETRVVGTRVVQGIIWCTLRVSVRVPWKSVHCRPFTINYLGVWSKVCQSLTGLLLFTLLSFVNVRDDTYEIVSFSFFCFNFSALYLLKEQLDDKMNAYDYYFCPS